MYAVPINCCPPSRVTTEPAPQQATPMSEIYETAPTPLARLGSYSQPMRCASDDQPKNITSCASPQARATKRQMTQQDHAIASHTANAAENTVKNPSPHSSKSLYNRTQTEPVAIGAQAYSFLQIGIRNNLAAGAQLTPARSASPSALEYQKIYDQVKNHREQLLSSQPGLRLRTNELEKSLQQFARSAQQDSTNNKATDLTNICLTLAREVSVSRCDVLNNFVRSTTGW